MSQSLILERLHDPHDMARALPRLVADLPADEQAHHLQTFASLLASPAAPAHLLVIEARQGEQRCGVALAQLLPGRTALVWPPWGAHRELVQELFAQLLTAASSHEVVVAQGLVPPDAADDAAAFTAAGFQVAGELAYMLAEIDRHSVPPILDELTFQAVAPHDLRLAQVIEASYHNSLDCPLVDGWRGIDDVLAGYLGTGTFQPELWQLALSQGAAVGCLLLSEYPEQRQGEVVYLGIDARQRGRGWGRLLLHQALRMAHARDWEQLVLAVDSANHPARRIYREAGFRDLLRRQVFVRRLRH